MKPPKTPEQLGTLAATEWTAPGNPFAEGTPEAEEWINAFLEARKTMSWNTRNIVQLGSTCFWLSEAVSAQLAIGVSKSILHIGAESPVLVRLGFVLNSFEHQLPELTTDGWRRIAQVANRSIQGMALEKIGLTGEISWLEKLTFLEGRDYLLKVLKKPLVADPEGKPVAVTVDTRELIPYMGGNSEARADLIPKPVAL